MLNLISSGDLDYGIVKRYICDSLDDFVELPKKVAPGSTVLVLDGSNYMIDENGNWNLISKFSNDSQILETIASLTQRIEELESHATMKDLNV